MKRDGRVVIRPSAGIKVATATVEVSTRPRLLDVHGISHLTIRGLSFTAASSCVSAGAVEIWEGSNILVEDSSFRWNNWDGLKLFSSTNSIVRRAFFQSQRVRWLDRSPINGCRFRRSGDLIQQLARSAGEILLF